MSKGHALKNVSVEFWRNMTQNAQWGYVRRLQEEIKQLRDANFLLRLDVQKKFEEALSISKKCDEIIEAFTSYISNQESINDNR